MLPKGSLELEHVWKRFRSDRKSALAREQFRRLKARLHGDHLTGWRWALRDLNLTAEPGESVGIVGTNGSGKTTLLRVLSGVMYPYAGSVSVAGTVGAIIEVRAGIHPDLTGRENISMYGTLLGLSRRDVARRFDDIVQFAELEEAIDRQLKFYSSGMMMRLGFAVAAFLEPDVLLVDEVLAVGDASFQQRCLERMRTVLAQGTTLLFVSHDLAAVEATCTRGIWLNKGVIEQDGPVREVLGSYRASIEEVAEYTSPASEVKVLEVGATGPAGEWARTQGPLEIRLVLESSEGVRGQFSNMILGVSEGPATPIFVLRRSVEITDGPVEIVCTIPRLPLPRGRFYVWLGAFRAGKEVLPWHPAAHFDVVGKELDPAPTAIVRMAPVHVDSEWSIGSPNGSRTTRKRPRTRAARGAVDDDPTLVGERS